LQGRTAWDAQQLALKYPLNAFNPRNLLKKWREQKNYREPEEDVWGEKEQ
jgi:hypothetical protein